MIHATFNKTRQDRGIITINAIGQAQLFKLNKSLTVGDQIDIEFDYKTNRIVIKKQVSGKFDVVESNVLLNAIMIRINVSKINESDLCFKIEDSDEPDRYDFVLIPIKENVRAENRKTADELITMAKLDKNNS